MNDEALVENRRRFHPFDFAFERRIISDFSFQDIFAKRTSANVGTAYEKYLHLSLFSPKRFREADVIIGMSKLNKPFVPFWWKKKFITISELVDGEYSEVPDPWLYKDIERYYAVMDRLKDYVERYAKQIENDKNR